MKRWPSRLPYIPPPCSLISYSDSALTKILAWYRSPQASGVTSRYSRTGPPPCPCSRPARREARTFGSAPAAEEQPRERCVVGTPPAVVDPEVVLGHHGREQRRVPADSVVVHRRSCIGIHSPIDRFLMHFPPPSGSTRWIQIQNLWTELEERPR